MTMDYELLKIILGFIATMAWPLTLLIILFVFRKQVKKIVSNTKKLELPGGVALEVKKDTEHTEQSTDKVKENADE